MIHLDDYVDVGLSSDNPDRNLLTTCIGSNDISCSKADFNGDKIINSADVALFDSAAIFDLNNNQNIDLRNISDVVVDYSKDLSILQACLFKMPEGVCTSSDLNGDRIIDFADTQSFIDAARFDLNRDNLIDYRNDTTEPFPVEPKVELKNENLIVLRDCFSADLAVIIECKKADFNKDNIVDIQDFFIFREGLIYDLDQDGFVDLRILIQSQDFTFFKNCFNRLPEGACLGTDFNSDGVIDITDFFIFSDNMVFDLNHDLIVDIYGTAVDSDRDFIENCLSLTTSACMPADFNQDGIVTGDDLNLLLQAVKYDFNVDGFIDFRERDASMSHDKKIIDNCAYFRTLGAKCKIADFNQDGFVNAEDVNEFKASTSFDLNKDQVVDLNDTNNNADLAIYNDCFSMLTADNPDCAVADFNSDGIVNINDFFIFKDAIIYDVNQDGFIDLRGSVLR